MKPKLYKLPKTKIPWADYVWNVTTGCTKVSPGCKFCYAEAYANRFWKDRPFSDVKIHPERLHFAELKTIGNIIFVNSMTDLFHKKITDNEIKAVLSVMYLYNNQWFVVLTKRPERARALLNSLAGVPSNLILGVSVEDNIEAPERLDLLMKTNVKYRCVSIEPYIPWKENTKKISQASEVILTRYIDSSAGKKGFLGTLNWVIVGAESGHGKRYCDELFIKNIVATCIVSKVPVFVKQIHSKKDSRGKFKVLSKPHEFPERLQLQQFMHECSIDRYVNGQDYKEWYHTHTTPVSSPHVFGGDRSCSLSSPNPQSGSLLNVSIGDPEKDKSSTNKSEGVS